MEKVKTILKYIQLYTNCNDYTLKRIEAVMDGLILEREVIKVVENTKEVLIQKKKSTESIKKWASRWLEENETSYSEVALRSRKVEVLTLRNRFCVDAYKEGFGLSEIGRYLKRDHTTILHSIHRVKTIKR
jgi:chromosomal replication initiation ATPase DnaA